MFNLDFSRYNILLLFILPAVINLGIYLYITLSFPRNKLNLLLGFFVLILAVWQTLEGLMRLSEDAETASAWYKVSGVAIVCVIASGLEFILRITNWKKFRSLFSVFLYLPITVILTLILIDEVRYSFVKSDTWSWVANPVPIFGTTLLIIWTSLGGLAYLILLLSCFIKSKTGDQRKKISGLLLVGFLLPVIGGIIGEALPLVFGYNAIPTTAVFVTSFSLACVIAIKKYGMLEFSPKHHWEDIVTQMNEGIMIVDNDDRIMYMNPSLCKMTGYEFLEVKGKNAKELLLDTDHVYIVDEAIKNHKIYGQSQFELKVKTKDGGRLWLQVSSAPYLDGNGKIIGSIGIQTDITHQKKYEDSLKHNESRLNQAQAVAKIGSWELSFSTGKGIWSDEACRIYGLTEEERNNQTFQGWLSYIHPEDLETVIHEIEKSKNILSNSSFKHRILRRDGTIKHIHSVAQFEYNTEGFPVGMFGVCHDITDQIEAELALFESETNMRTFINESLMSIYFVDPVTMKIAYSNPALSDLLGYSPEELKLMNLDDFINQSENNITCSTDNAITTKRICNSERQWKRKDGRIVHVLVNSFCHKQNGSNVIYVAAQDISERKKTEEKLEATNKELELFIYKASHDIRGPLASVMGLVNVSKLELQDQKALKYLDMINVATQKLDGTLGELMKAMKMKDVVASQKINFEELIADLIKKFAHFPGFERLTIEKEICVSGTFVSNQSVLETILQNLIENSIKYQRTTGTDPYLKIRITGDEKAINITVKDNGMGIEDSVQSQVFNMYFRANETSKGSGLGLYLVKKGVDKLHGQITLKSKVNQGTTFEVVIASEEQNYMQAG